jgi:hypothetical protein
MPTAPGLGWAFEWDDARDNQTDAELVSSPRAASAARPALLRALTLLGKYAQVGDHSTPSIEKASKYRYQFA